MSDVKKMVLKYGYDKQRKGLRTVSAKVVCQGCGEEISSDDIPSDLNYSLTKRKTCIFFHGKCYGSVWNSFIKYHGTVTTQSSKPTSKVTARSRSRKSKTATT